MEKPYLKGIDRRERKTSKTLFWPPHMYTAHFVCQYTKNYTHFNKYILCWEDGSALTTLVEDLAT